MRGVVSECVMCGVRGVPYRLAEKRYEGQAKVKVESKSGEVGSGPR